MRQKREFETAQLAREASGGTGSVLAPPTPGQSTPAPPQQVGAAQAQAAQLPPSVGSVVPSESGVQVLVYLDSEQISAKVVTRLRTGLRGATSIGVAGGT